MLTGPCGPEPWYVEVAQGADPTAVAARLTRANVGEPLLVHSTSWRTARGGVVVTFVVVIEDGKVPPSPPCPSNASPSRVATRQPRPATSPPHR